ncbi:MAG: TlpA family protein disulfide reductase [Bacteroidales bacterium]|nr:TlpA family protein disulfide reductase [Bacteroidales bacterium]
MKNKLLTVFPIALFWLFGSFYLSAGTVTLFSNASEWHSADLVFYRYKELITRSEEEIGATKTSAGGAFELTLTIDDTEFIFTRLGIYQLYLYAEPGKKYELALPPYQEKSPADLLNPYYEALTIQAGIVNIDENDINMLIRMFDDSFEPFYSKHVVESVSGKDFSKLDEDIGSIEAPFRKTDNKYFKDYREYKYAFLRYLSLQHQVTVISEMFFTGKPVLYHNQAYMELFNQVFDDYFLYHGRTDKGKKIYDDINVSKDYGALYKTLKKNELFKDDTFLELVVLKNLFDEFYNDKFSRSGILQVLDTLAARTVIPESREIAKIIRHKITKLLAGYPPPDFELYDLDSNLVHLNDFRGKYLYLNFCACSSYSCLKEFELLQGVYERHKDRIEIVTVAVDSYEVSLGAFLKKNNYHWKFLYYGHGAEIMKDYDIRAFPTYFLIGPDGNLIQSPAPGPQENFEGKLFEIMRSRGDL